MNIYVVQVQTRDTKAWHYHIDGEAKSRRAFIKANAEAINKLRKGTQFKVGLYDPQSV